MPDGQALVVRRGLAAKVRGDVARQISAAMLAVEAGPVAAARALLFRS